MNKLRAYLDWLCRLEGHHGVTGVNGSDKCVLILQNDNDNYDIDDKVDDETDLDPDDVTDGAHVKLGGHPGQQPTGEGGGSGNNMAELELVLRNINHSFLFRSGVY